MKTLPSALFVAIVLAVIAVSSLKGQAPATPQYQGRFQIMQGEYEGSSNGTTINQNSISRIDTATGKVWMLVVALNKDKYILKWSSIDGSN